MSPVMPRQRASLSPPLLFVQSKKVTFVAMGLEALPHVLMQEVWNKARQLQNINGFIPIWNNGHYGGTLIIAMWTKMEAVWNYTYGSHINQQIEYSFASLQAKFNLPQSIFHIYSCTMWLGSSQKELCGYNLRPPISHYMTEVSFQGNPISALCHAFIHTPGGLPCQGDTPMGK